PITYGQVFTGWAQAVREAAEAVDVATRALHVIGIGGTAVGTGLTAHPRFRSRVVRELSRLVGQRLTPATSTVTTTWSLRPLLACSAALRGVAVDVAKICADLRLLASGPHTGFGELSLPEVEPGSSIMPGKVNPSVPEAVQMACYQVCGYDHAIALAAAAGEPRAGRRPRAGQPDRSDGAVALPRIRGDRRARQRSAGVGTFLPRRRRGSWPRRSRIAGPLARSERDHRPATRRRGVAPAAAGHARLPAGTGGDVIKPLPIVDGGPYFR